ncbi:GNAT family N-acetyltransferase [Legionella sp. km772]|uniref:GNAT family N-acetyltransferase n=1 Tax=Legionella sp. km772 TaxID=2498111 RepID=UPI000F8CE1C5|nr:GNAT family N-acetyltransferase [Legionella sp. km772]RUR08875.1 N-acetyltransferase [Legionella sp. km772]
MKQINTERLLLRTWNEKDVLPFYEMGQDPRVMEYFPSLWTMEMVKDFINRMVVQLLEKNYTLWALEEKKSQQFIGFVGLNTPTWETPFTPNIEIGWRLAFNYWGKGYASEAAKAVLGYAFASLALSEITAFTVANNWRSRKVMERIGMRRDQKGDFLHPKLEPNHPMALHVLYRIKNHLIKN